MTKQFYCFACRKIVYNSEHVHRLKKDWLPKLSEVLGQSLRMPPKVAHICCAHFEPHRSKFSKHHPAVIKTSFAAKKMVGSARKAPKKRRRSWTNPDELSFWQRKKQKTLAVEAHEMYRRINELEEKLANQPKKFEEIIEDDLEYYSGLTKDEFDKLLNGVRQWRPFQTRKLKSPSKDSQIRRMLVYTLYRLRHSVSYRQSAPYFELKESTARDWFNRTILLLASLHSK